MQNPILTFILAAICVAISVAISMAEPKDTLCSVAIVIKR